METTYIGPWILLGLGTLLMLAAIYIAVVQRGRPFNLLVFGFLSIGVGIHGPLFMGQYAEFLRVMVSLAGTADPDPETYKAVFDRIGQGDFDPELQEIALGYALGRPIPDMDRLLSEAMEGSTNDQGRDALYRLAAAASVRAREKELAAMVPALPIQGNDEQTASLEQAKASLEQAKTTLEQRETAPY